MTNRLIPVFTQFFKNGNDPNNGGKLYFYQTGSSSTLKGTYSDVGESTPNANPYILDSSGLVATDVFGSGSYNVVVTDSNDVATGQEVDPVGGLTTGQLDEWNSLSTYNLYGIVQKDGQYYRSLTNSNVGNDPESDTTNWEEIEFVNYYNANKTYAENDGVRDANGLTYTSLADSNTGNTPSETPLKWAAMNSRSTIVLTSDPSTADMVLYKEHNLPVFINTGASGAVEIPLPAAVVGLAFGFSIDAVQYLRATCDGTDIVADGVQNSAAGGYVRNNTEYLYWELQCFQTGVWSLTKLNGVLLYDE